MGSTNRYKGNVSTAVTGDKKSITDGEYTLPLDVLAQAQAMATPEAINTMYVAITALTRLIQIDEAWLRITCSTDGRVYWKLKFVAGAHKGRYIMFVQTEWQSTIDGILGLAYKYDRLLSGLDKSVKDKYYGE